MVGGYDPGEDPKRDARCDPDNGPSPTEGFPIMPAAEYEFVTIWEVAGTPDEVFDILDDPADLARWWPSVYLDVVVDEPGDERGVGKVVSLVTKGWLPYRLRWSFRVTEKDRPTRIALDPWGDLDEHDGWMITPHGALVRARYDWRVRADKPLLRHLSFLFKPVFSANHRWAMCPRDPRRLSLVILRVGPEDLNATDIPGRRPSADAGVWIEICARTAGFSSWPGSSALGPGMDQNCRIIMGKKGVRSAARQAASVALFGATVNGGHS